MTARIQAKTGIRVPTVYRFNVHIVVAGIVRLLSLILEFGQPKKGGQRNILFVLTNIIFPMSQVRI